MEQDRRGPGPTTVEHISSWYSDLPPASSSTSLDPHLQKGDQTRSLHSKVVLRI